MRALRVPDTALQSVASEKVTVRVSPFASTLEPPQSLSRSHTRSVTDGVGSEEQKGVPLIAREELPVT